MQSMTFWMGLVVIGFCSGCSNEGPIDDEDAVQGENALVQYNALTTNALTTNALTTNALTTNALTTNALSADALSALEDPSIAGTNARSFMHYAVGCALSPSQTFDFTWTDSDAVEHQESYHGELGIAPGWAAGGIPVSSQKLVSACMIARVNYYGVTVKISIRSAKAPLETMPGSQELVDFPHVEGAFWGNLWAPVPNLKACYFGPNIAVSRAAHRDCAVGHILPNGALAECGPIDIVGPCSTVCQNLDGGGQYYPACVERPFISNEKTKFVVTVGLP